MRERRPSQGTIAIRGGDGREHRIAITAIPLLRDGAQLPGAAALSWELPTAVDD